MFSITIFPLKLKKNMFQRNEFVNFQQFVLLVQKVNLWKTTCKSQINSGSFWTTSFDKSSL
jgi:hypothetical protein